MREPCSSISDDFLGPAYENEYALSFSFGTVPEISNSSMHQFDAICKMRFNYQVTVEEFMLLIFLITCYDTHPLLTCSRDA